MQDDPISSRPGTTAGTAADTRGVAPVGLPDRVAVEAYLAEVRAGLDDRAAVPPDAPEPDPTCAPLVADAVFAVLTSQRFGYLGRKRSEPYREDVTAHLRRDVEHGHPLHFFLDIGPGYHASIDPDSLGLCFDVGLAELLALRQVVDFCNRVVEHHTPGARFALVVDNLCGLATNDIPLERSQDYVRQLRELIASVGAADRVTVLVESELNDEATYRARLEQEEAGPLPAVSAADVDNVARFLGRRCSEDEAAERIERYRRTGIVTEELLAPAIHGVRLTQRATALTLGFRAFPGGDQRIQVGQLALGPGKKGRLRPVLVSSRNAPELQLAWVELGEDGPVPLRSVLTAAPRDPQSAPSR